MKKVDENLWNCTSSELRNSKPSDFGNDAIIYVRPDKGYNKYVIFLIKKKYNIFALESKVEDVITGKPLTTPGSQRGMRPYFIDDFLSRE